MEKTSPYVKVPDALIYEERERKWAKNSKA